MGKNPVRCEMRSVHCAPISNRPSNGRPEEEGQEAHKQDEGQMDFRVIQSASTAASVVALAPSNWYQMTWPFAAGE